jgi:hypothetical protein
VPTWRRFREVVALSLLALPLAAAIGGSAGAQGWPEVFEPTQLLTLNLQMTPGDWNTVQNDSSLSIEVPASFWADGEAPISVGVRRKSATPLNAGQGYSKVALRVDINEFVLGQDWRELKMLSLENGDDNNVIGEGFAWHVHRLASGTHGYGYSDAAAHEAWVRLVINGVDTGVYVSPEMRDKRFMENRGFYVEGATWLYEVEDKNTATIIQQEGPAFDSPATEALCYEPFAQSPSCTFPGDVAISLPQIVQMSGLLTLMAGDAFVVNPDGTLTNGKNFYFVDFLSGLRMYYPWDLDAAPSGNPNLNIYAPRRTSEYAELLDVPEFRSQYSRIWNDLICGPWSEASLHGLLDAVEPVISAAVDADPNNQLGESAATYFNTLRSFVTNRVAHAVGEIEGFQPCPTVQLELNEVMASNVATLEDPAEPGEFPDWFEIRNPAGVSVDVGGVYVTDDPTDPTKYQIPAGVTIPAQGYLLMYADDDGTQGPEHTNFKLGVGGETLQLYDTDGVTLLDSVSFGPQTTDVAYGRFPNGSGPWDFLGAATPGSANGPHNPPPALSDTQHDPALPGPAALVWVSTAASDDSALASVLLHYDSGGGEVIVAMQDDGASADGAAGDGVYGAAIPPFSDDTLVRYWVTATDDLGAAAVDPLVAPAVSHAYVVGYEPPPLVVNEFMAQNDSVIEDPQEPLAYEDWFELYNAGPGPVWLDGMYASDDPLQPTKYALPAGLVVPGGGHLLLWADAEPIQGSAHVGFRLGAAGESIGIYDTDARGNLPIDAFSFGVQAPDTAEGRCPDGHQGLVALGNGSPAAPNLGAPGCAAGEIVLFAGSPLGGEVHITIDGVLVGVATTAGQSLEQVLRALADAVDADPVLAAAGTTASALGPQLSTNGSVEAIEISDPGISASGGTAPANVPAVGMLLRTVLAALLVAGGLRLERRS